MNTFLYHFTVFPLRILYIVCCLTWRWIRRFLLKLYKLSRGSMGIQSFIFSYSAMPLIEAGFWVDLLKASVILCTSYCLSWVDPSILYHSIRGQSMVKLYVIFNVCEVADKLLCSFGLDIMNSLLAPPAPAPALPSETPPVPSTHFPSKVQSSSVNNSTSSFLNSSTSFSAISTSSSVRHLKPVTYFLLAVLYTFLHSMVLFYQVITLNVAINSYNNALLTLLLSNQFVEIKGSVFKKFEKENLFQLSCSGKH